MVHTVPSALVSHDSASSGAASNSLVKPNRPSNTCPMMCGNGCDTVDCQSSVCGVVSIATSSVPPYFGPSEAALAVSDAGLAHAPATTTSAATNPAISCFMNSSLGNERTYSGPHSLSNCTPENRIARSSIACNIQVAMGNYTRLLRLRADPPATFFLWGPRQSGKSTLLGAEFPEVPWVDLLLPATYRRYLQAPELLIEEQRRHGADFIVIDEVQKVPALLDVVHWLIERRGVHFALCGSSARKVRRRQANLLGGRGERRELHGLSAMEIGPEVDLGRLLNHGYLPPIYDAARPLPLLDAYVSQYLKEEIAAEGLVRRLPAYADFLALAALSDGDAVNYTTIARDTGTSSQTVRGYFEILAGHAARPLPARISQAPEAAGSGGAEVLLRGRGRGKLSGPARCAATGWRAVREGVRELGVPRAVLLQRVPRPLRRLLLLAAQFRYRSRLRGQPHRLRHRSQGGESGTRAITPRGCANCRPITRRPRAASSCRSIPTTVPPKTASSCSTTARS